MTRQTDRRRQATPFRRSSSAGLSPYLVEDVALTPADLQAARTTDVIVVTPRCAATEWEARCHPPLILSSTDPTIDRSSWASTARSMPGWRSSGRPTKPDGADRP